MDWTVIRNLGRVKYFNISYVVIFGVPVLAEIFRHVNKLATGHDLRTFEFPLDLKLLYGSSLAYAAAIAAYQLFCPTSVKAHESSEQYVVSLLDLYERAYPERKLEVALANIPSTEVETLADLVRLSERLYGEDLADAQRAKAELDSRLSTLYPSLVQHFLVKRFDQDRVSRPVARWIAAIGYFLGTAGVLYLLVHKSINVFAS